MKRIQSSSKPASSGNPSRAMFHQGSGSSGDRENVPLSRLLSRHVRVDESSANRVRPAASSSSIYSRSPRPGLFRTPSAHSRAQSSGARTPLDSHSPRASVSALHLQHLLENLHIDQYNTFGVEELRDGFFDATVYRPIKHESVDEYDNEEEDSSGLRMFFRRFLETQFEDMRFFFRVTFKTHQGIFLLKSFVGYFITYILCLIPRTQEWLGRYSYWILIAALFNHSGRTFGSQVDGTVSCALGAGLGLGFGALALEVAYSTSTSRHGYGGVLATFLILFSGLTSWIRCSILRLYQATISAGLAAIFLCLVDTTNITEDHVWDRHKIWEFAIPWLVGLGVCLLVNVAIFPEAGGRDVIIVLHKAFIAALEGLELPGAYSLDMHSNMSQQLVDLSEAVRDMRLDLTFTSLKPTDVEKLRNLLQRVIRALMAIKPETSLFEGLSSDSLANIQEDTVTAGEIEEVAIKVEPAESVAGSDMPSEDSYDSSLNLVRRVMAPPARDLIEAMSVLLRSCDTELMDIAGYRHELQKTTPLSLKEAQAHLGSVMKIMDDADVSLIDHPDLPTSYSTHPELVGLFLFIHPLRQTADAICTLASKVIEISEAPNSRRKRFFLPSYPLGKALHRGNAQVRHDRGGTSAVYYFRTKYEIDKIMATLHSNPYVLASDLGGDEKVMVSINNTADSKTLRYRTWQVFHRLQEWETRFAFKVILATSLLSIPAWLEQSRLWWLASEAWWAVAASWLMMHPRVGGNSQDLITRSVATAGGAVYAGLACAAGEAAGSGRPYVVGAFAAVYMIPCIFRFTSSSHPRSGLMACISFSVVSMSTYNLNYSHSITYIAWTRGVSLLVGVLTTVLVNWIVWPFVARHELRKSLSSMLLNLGISYRGVVARYIYHSSDYTPTQKDIEASEVAEAKLREGCFRMRELVEMTAHEIRPRGPFNATPYKAAIDACERFLEHIVEVRQASLYFQPFLFRGSEEATRRMVGVRRDAVASILMNLYILAGALRSKRPVPRYLPSAAAARKRLLDRMAEIEEENEAERYVTPRPEKSRRWADVYQYAYSAALTDIVAQVELLEILTKTIMGEMALDAPDLIE